MKRRLKQTIIAVVVLLVLGIVARIAYSAYIRAVYPIRYEDIVTECAAEYELPPSLIYAVIHTESHFQEDAVSRAGAKGLMQLMDTTFEWIQEQYFDEPISVDRILEPSVNIHSGSKVLAVLHTMFTHTETALAAYNAGSGTVKKWLADAQYSADGETLTDIPYLETEHYVERVLQAQKRYQTLYEIP